MTNDNFLNPSQRTYTFDLDDELAMCIALHQREQDDRELDSELEARILGEPPDWTPAPPLDQEWINYNREIGLSKEATP
jgi:hypothetical protein